jgi:small subunit ribosomal protein S8
MQTDPIADFLTRIKNGYMAHKASVSAPYSNLKEELVKILSKTGAVGKFDIVKDNQGKKEIQIELSYINKKPSISHVERISKPGKRVYSKTGSIPKVLGGMGQVIISTPKGLMTGKDAGLKKQGGELICKFW